MAAVNVISGERERQSLELLFLTPISSRSLLLQKFSGAVTLLSMVLLTFLPAEIAACCYGGVTLWLFGVWYLVLAAQITCTVSIGMLASCLIANTRMALIASFTVTFLLPVLLYFLLAPFLDQQNQESEAGSSRSSASFPCWQLSRYTVFPPASAASNASAARREGRVSVNKASSPVLLYRPVARWVYA